MDPDNINEATLLSKEFAYPKDPNYHVGGLWIESLYLPNIFFSKNIQVKASPKCFTDQSAKKFLTNQSEINLPFFSELIKDINEISAWVTWVDMELRSYLPRVPFLPAGPTGPLGKKGTLGR